MCMSETLPLQITYNKVYQRLSNVRWREMEEASPSVHKYMWMRYLPDLLRWQVVARKEERIHSLLRERVPPEALV